MKNYLMEIRTWSGAYVTITTVSDTCYANVFRSLTEQYPNHRFTMMGVENCEFCND
jgi:hypothetical protein